MRAACPGQSTEFFHLSSVLLSKVTEIQENREGKLSSIPHPHFKRKRFVWDSKTHAEVRASPNTPIDVFP